MLRYIWQIHFTRRGRIKKTVIHKSSWILVQITSSHSCHCYRTRTFGKFEQRMDHLCNFKLTEGTIKSSPAISNDNGYPLRQCGTTKRRPPQMRLWSFYLLMFIVDIWQSIRSSIRLSIIAHGAEWIHTLGTTDDALRFASHTQFVTRSLGLCKWRQEMRYDALTLVFFHRVAGAGIRI